MFKYFANEKGEADIDYRSRSNWSGSRSALGCAAKNGADPIFSLI